MRPDGRRTRFAYRCRTIGWHLAPGVLGAADRLSDLADAFLGWLRGAPRRGR